MVFEIARDAVRRIRVETVEGWRALPLKAREIGSFWLVKEGCARRDRLNGVAAKKL
jgi:hypothetical protein